MEPTLLRRRDVQRLTTLSRSTLYRRMNAGEFPRPISLGGRTVAWRKSDIDKWLEDRPRLDGVNPNMNPIPVRAEHPAHPAGGALQGGLRVGGPRAIDEDKDPT